MKLLTFFNTDEATLGSGIGWSDSPTSMEGQDGQMRDSRGSRGGGIAFKHVFDEDAALSDFLVDDELLII